MSIKYSTVRWITYDCNGMYIGDFEDRQCAEEWANKHGGRIDKHSIEHEESRIYDSILMEEVRKETAKEIFKALDEIIAKSENVEDVLLYGKNFYETGVLRRRFYVYKKDIRTLKEKFGVEVEK